MALSRNKEQQKPAFEQEPNGEAAASETTAAAAPQETAKAETKVDQPAAAVQATTAIARAQTTAVSVAEAAAKAKAFQKEVEDMKGASDFSYGNYDVYKGNNGEIVKGEDSLGRWAKVRMIAWDEHFEVSPGEEGASSKDFVAYSKDGKTIESVIGEDQRGWVGKSVDEYLAYLRDDSDEGEGFEKAGVRRFIDIACALLSCENAEDAPLNTVIQVTLSQSSIPAFSKYQEDLKNNARCVAMGLPGFVLPEDPFTFFLLRELATKDGKKGKQNWTKLKIVSTLPNKI
jgi:hypothetical protein